MPTKPRAGKRRTKPPDRAPDRNTAALDKLGYCVCGHHYVYHGTPFSSGMTKYPVHLDPKTPPPVGHVTCKVVDGKGPCCIAWEHGGETCDCLGFRRAKHPKPKPLPPPPPPRKQKREALF